MNAWPAKILLARFSKSLLEGSFGRFIVSGLVNSAVGVSVVFALMLLGQPPILSNLVGYACGLSVSFVLNRYWVFASTQSSPLLQILKFAGCFGCAYLLNLLILQTTLSQEVNPYLAQLIAMASYSLSFYALNRFVAFQD